MRGRQSDDDEPDDSDRVAILARRQRFIALALSGLATAGACTPTEREEPPPEKRPEQVKQENIIPCLSPRQPDRVTPPVTPDLGKPTPCLSVERLPPPTKPEEKPDAEPVPEIDAHPAPCLSMRPPPREK